MKEDFIDLIDQLDTISARFHKVDPGRSYRVHSVSVIWDIPEFQNWIQNIQLELQDIVDRTADSFAADTLDAAKKRYTGWNDREYFNELNGKLLAMRKNIDKYYPQVVGKGMDAAGKPPKIFISHSSNDKDYVSKVVELLTSMGLNRSQIFCSSLPGYDIPVGADIFDYLRELFHSFQLHVFFIHSKNYYSSAVSLNEMGAAWVLRNKYTSLLLPGFGFSNMAGVANNETIAIKLDNEGLEVKDKLNQLYETIAEEFGLTWDPGIVWEKNRDQFIKEINEIVPPDDVTRQV